MSAATEYQPIALSRTGTSVTATNRRSPRGSNRPIDAVMGEHERDRDDGEPALEPEPAPMRQDETEREDRPVPEVEREARAAEVLQGSGCKQAVDAARVPGPAGEQHRARSEDGPQRAVAGEAAGDVEDDPAALRVRTIEYASDAAVRMITQSRVSEWKCASFRQHQRALDLQRERPEVLADARGVVRGVVVDRVGGEAPVLQEQRRRDDPPGSSAPSAPRAARTPRPAPIRGPVSRDGSARRDGSGWRCGPERRGRGRRGRGRRGRVRRGRVRRGAGRRTGRGGVRRGPPGPLRHRVSARMDDPVRPGGQCTVRSPPDAARARR